MAEYLSVRISAYATLSLALATIILALVTAYTAKQTGEELSLRKDGQIDILEFVERCSIEKDDDKYRIPNIESCQYFNLRLVNVGREDVNLRPKIYLLRSKQLLPKPAHRLDVGEMHVFSFRLKELVTQGLPFEEFVVVNHAELAR